MRKEFTLMLLLLSLMSLSQTPNYNATDKRINAYRNSFWFEANLSGTIARYADSAAKWQYQIDLQYRSMADANYVKNGQKNNIFSDPYQQVYRPWIHYWIKPKTVRLSLSPIGYWATWTPSKETGGRLFYSEYRICPQLTLFQKVGKLEIQQRYRYEFRWQSTKVNAEHASPADYSLGDNFVHNGEKMRMRYLLRLNMPLNGKSTGTKGSLYLSAWNEVFIGLGANTNNTKLLDQDRFVFMIGKYFKSSFPVKLEVGYTLQYLPKYDTDVAAGQSADGPYNYGKLNWEMNSCVQVFLICDDFHSLFKKRKK